MRTDGHNEHNDWLLKVGTGDLEPNQEVPYTDTIEIPQHMIGTDDLITSIFGENIHQLSVEELAKRVILHQQMSKLLS